MKTHFYLKCQNNESNYGEMYRYREFYILIFKTWSLDVKCLFQKESEVTYGFPFFFFEVRKAFLQKHLLHL